MKDIDKTKQNIRINEIDEDQRNDLFKRFVDAGGQIIDDKSTKKNIIINREKQREHQKKLDKHYSDQKSAQRKKNTDTSDRDSLRSASNAPISSIFDRAKIRIKLKFLGVTGFSAVFLKKSFFKKFVNHYKPALITIQMIYLSLFKKNLQTGNRIIRTLDKISPKYYELIEMTGELYEEYLIDQITENFKNYPNIPQSVSELKEPLIELYRALYILKPYENTIYNAFERAIEINSASTESKGDWFFKNKDIKNSLFFIFDKLYPRLHTLFCLYQGILYDESDKEIENILSITKHEKPGTRIKQSLNSVIQVEENEAEKAVSKQTKDYAKIDNSIKEGLRLMYKLDNKILRNKYDKKGDFELLNDTDKVLLTYLLFKEFENEYSFILTTNKIRYNVDFSTNIKIDYRAKMQDLFNKLNKCQEAFKDYYEMHQEFNKNSKEKPANNNQYIAYSKKLDEIDEKKNIAGITYRATIKKFMDDLTTELSILINDINSEQKFIANPQDVLEFNPAIEGEKKLNGRKIYDAIMTLYNFASAFSYRISPEGDLSGKLEFKENEKQINIEDESSQKNADNISEKSILDELDDLV
ncbi:MAG: hypothetical protein FWF73_08140 [Spirochaetes bacterium]|nr:hypothetical protein [Spirochaetota bacterium]